MTAEPETPLEGPTVAETAADPRAGAEPTDAELRSREAASYRTRLGAAEQQLQERDGVVAGLRDELDRLHRVEAERVAAREGMALPADLWTLHQLAELRDDDGRLDSAKVTETVRAVLADRPTWRREPLDLGGGARGGSAPRQPRLSKLLKPERR